MRKANREIKDRNEVLQVIKNSDVCRIAFFDEEYPYILPFNFGFTEEDGRLVFYFHGAVEGKKYELMQANPKVGFEMDTKHELIYDYEHGNCTMAYESVVGTGEIELIDDADFDKKMKGLQVILDHYREPDFPINEKVVAFTRVFKLRVVEMKGKRRPAI